VSDAHAEPFLGPEAFSGSGTYVPKSTMATTGGRATYRGNIVFTNLDRALVNAILPSGSELKLAQNRIARGLHPVLYLYGHPEQTSWIIDDEPYLNGASYQELILLVPFVQKGSGTLWHSFVARMYLDNGVAIWIGNEYYAYAKEFGTLRESNLDVRTSEVTGYDSDDIVKFRAQSKRTGGWRSSDQAKTDLPNFAAIQTILAMPVVGWRPSSSSPGRLVCSYFELSYTNARVAPVESTHEFLDPFVPGMSNWMGLGSLSQVPDGAVAVRDLTWRIDHPPPAECRF
jgi:hypothetical protein